MVENSSLLKTFEEYNERTIIFGDGKKSKIARKGSIQVEGIPKLEEVLHVERFKANM